jgi:hypothetical protein
MKEVQTDGVCRTLERRDVEAFYMENLKVISVGGRLTLKEILNKYPVRVWTGFM